MKRITTTLFDNSTKDAAPATLIDGVDQALINQTEAKWQKPRLEGALRLAQQGVGAPEHYHWDWTRKSSRVNLLAYRCFGIECDGEMQGLMMLNSGSQFSRMLPDKGRPLAYIDYLESAPWNIKGMVTSPRYGAVGARLIEAAVRFSLSEGFGGRVGLHALPQAENFYLKTCQMTRVEQDSSVENLWWFEWTSEQARLFLTG